MPVALGGGPYGVVDDVYFRLLDALDLGAPVPPFRTGHNISYQDDRLFARLGIDTRYVWPALAPSSPAVQTGDPSRFLDSYGQPWIRATPYFYADEGILTDAAQVDDIDRRLTWPDTSLPKWTVGVAERARTLHEDTDCYVIGRMVTSHGPFQTACDLRGTEQFLMDLALDPDFARHLLNRVTDTIDGLLRNYLEACGPFIDMVELPGDDYAGNESLVISPRMFRTYIKPALARLVNTAKTFRADLKVMLHSDGNIQPLLADFVEIGVDVVHPLEPLPSMDLDAIKAEFGQKLAFLGGIDISHAMPGTREDVIAEVRRRIAQLGRGGGYVLSPSNHLQNDVPAENVIALFDAARQYGVYPLKV